MTPADLIAALRAHPDAADPLMRAACAELRSWQREARLSSGPSADALRAGLARIAPAGLDGVLGALLEDSGLLPQLPLRAGGRGAVTDDLAALLRPAELAWDEVQEIDWAVRHWEASRADGLLDEALSADFGEYWRRLEWSALRLHLIWLGQGHAEERRLLAYIAKTASRYVSFAPLKRAMEARCPEFFELGFSLR